MILHGQLDVTPKKKLFKHSLEPVLDGERINRRFADDRASLQLWKQMQKVLDYDYQLTGYFYSEGHLWRGANIGS